VTSWLRGFMSGARWLTNARLRAGKDEMGKARHVLGAVGVSRQMPAFLVSAVAAVSHVTRGRAESSVHDSVRHDTMTRMSSDLATQGVMTQSGQQLARRPRLLWLYEIVLIGIGYWAYSWIRNAVPSEEGTAVHRAHQVVRLERGLHIFHERGLNEFVAGQHWLAYVSNYYYATLHFVVTIGVGVWVYRKRSWYARRLRNAWYAANLFGLLGFAFLALAPPRLLPDGGFVDTVVRFHTWGSWGDASVASHSNQYAAMPSMHIAWSLWSGLVLYKLARHTWVRLLGLLYPFATLFVIIGTGNHYFLDAVGGVVALALGFAAQRLLSGKPAFAPPPERVVVTLPAGGEAHPA
jgi:hypothetical protein